MEDYREAEAFENVKGQIGFCGIWCGGCAVANGVLRELGRRYKDVINKYGLKRWAPKDFDFGEFYKGLESIENMPLCAGCLKGGGRDDCEIRSCAKAKGVEDCTQCEQFGNCEHSKFVKHMRLGAANAGLSVISKDDDRKKFIEEQMKKFDK
jgi:hypothetical protein